MSSPRSAPLNALTAVSVTMRASEIELKETLIRDAERALVERASRQRLQRVAILFGVRGGHVRVERLLVAPRLNHREVIGAHRVLQHVESQIAGLLPARVGKLAKNDGDLRVWCHVDVRDDIDDLTSGRVTWLRSNRQRLVGTLIVAAHANPLERVLHPLLYGGVTRIERLLIAPRLDDGVVSRPADLLEELGADEALLRAARIAVLLQCGCGGGGGRGGRLDVRDRVESRVGCGGGWSVGPGL